MIEFARGTPRVPYALDGPGPEPGAVLTSIILLKLEQREECVCVCARPQISGMCLHLGMLMGTTLTVRATRPTVYYQREPPRITLPSTQNAPTGGALEAVARQLSRVVRPTQTRFTSI